MGVSGVAFIRPSQIHHYVYGECQGTLEIQECMEGIFRLHLLDPAISLLQQPEIDPILCIGEAPTRYIRARHFPPLGDSTHATVSTCGGPWHNVAWHSVTLYVCTEFWSIIDPLKENLPKPPRKQLKLRRAPRKSFTSRNLPIPPLPAYQ